MAASSSSVNSRNTNRRSIIRSRCDCGDPVGNWTSWTRKNPGRRFIGCPNFMDEERDCRLFQFIDPPLPNDWYKKLVFNLHANANPNAAAADYHQMYEGFEVPEPVPHVEVPLVPRNVGVIEGNWKLGMMAFVVAVMWFFFK